METLEGRRHEVRVSLVFGAVAALLTAFALVIGDVDRSPWWVKIATLIPAAICVGLLIGSHVARWIAAILLGVAGAVGLLSTLTGFADFSPETSTFYVGNALASTVMFTWLCTAGSLGLLLPRCRTTWVTIRLVGGCLAMIAISHLSLASVVGFTGRLDGVSINLRLAGVSVWSFPGWSVWHGTMAATALVMAFGPRRVLRHACSALFLLFVLLLLLTLVSLLGTGSLRASIPTLLVWSTLLLPLYLTWWLTDNATER